MRGRSRVKTFQLAPPDPDRLPHRDLTSSLLPRLHPRPRPARAASSVLRNFLSCCCPRKIPASARPGEDTNPSPSPAMNGTQSARHGRPAPAGPTPPAPAAAPPVPPNPAAGTHTNANTTTSAVTTPPPAPARQTNGASVNGTHAPAQKGKKKAAEQPVDPSQMYETLKNRIAALEEEEVHEEEEERRFGKWSSHARSSISSTLHAFCGE